MRTFTRGPMVAAVAAALGLVGAAVAPAQDVPAPASGNNAASGNNDARIESLEKRMAEVEQRHQRDLAASDAEINRLRQQLQTAGPTTGPAVDTDPSASAAAEARLQQELIDDIRTGNAAPAAAARAPVSFNPDLAVIGDFIANYSPNAASDNDAYNRLDLRELELDLRAAVHPKADAVAIIALHRHVENPVFEHHHEEEGEEEEEGHGGGYEVGVEEGYVFLHDFGVPNLTAKIGRFNLRFGRQNVLHLHDLPTVEPSYVNQAFLSPESLNDAGVSLSYVIPPALTAGQYVEVIGELVSGEGANSESPTLGGDFGVDSPAFNGHLLWNTDLARTVNFELGGSYLTGPRDDTGSNQANLFGVDATLVFRDPTGGFNNTLLQAEGMYGIFDLEDGTNEESWGAYLLAQQQLARDWYAGVRLDYAQNPEDNNEEAWGASPYVSWYWTEFLRFRASYEHRDGDREHGDEDVLWLQATWIFGAHPPHPYWAMR
ncbi:MAG TPA: hypothetical protein VK324_14250 [Tepidisphaeraceae bacterium]|nr:hypothetical protein [Tepidisphaeraceae bacterium]